MSNTRKKRQSNDQAVSSSMAAAAAASAASSSMPYADVVQIDSIQPVPVDTIDLACSPLVALPDELKCMIDAHLPFSAKANLALTCRAYHSFFNQTLVKTIDTDYQAKHTQPDYQLTYQPYIRFHRKQVQKFLNHVIHGEQEEAETMLKRDPGLLLAVGKVEDYSGRKIEGTALQMALGAEDVKYHDDEECMVEMIHKYLKQLPNGEAIIAEQTAKQFPEGWEQKEEERQARDHAALVRVINVIANPPGANDTERNTATENAIQAFRDYLAAENKGAGKIFRTGKHFNHQLLVEAFDLYNQNYDSVGGYDSAKNNAVWRKVIGTIERYVPAATAQALCTGVGTIVDEKGKLQRKLTLHNYHSNRAISYFPLDGDSASVLGRDFAVYGYWARGARVGGCGVWRACASGLPLRASHVVTKLMSNKNIKLAALMQRPQPQPDRTATGCVIS